MGNISSEKGRGDESDHQNSSANSDSGVEQRDDQLSSKYQTLRDIREMLESKQPLELWIRQMHSVDNFINLIRRSYLDNPDCKDALKLQKKLRVSSLNLFSGVRSFSCSERLISYGKKSRENDEKPRRTQSLPPFDSSIRFFNDSVADLLDFVYSTSLNTQFARMSRSIEIKMTATSEKFHDSVDRFASIMTSTSRRMSEYLNDMIEQEQNSPIGNNTFQYHTFVEIQRESETNEKLNEQQSKEAKLDEAKQTFQNLYRNFVELLDECRCTFLRDGRGQDKATIAELALHAHHRLQSSERVKEMIINILRNDSSDDESEDERLNVSFESDVDEVFEERRRQSQYTEQVNNMAAEEQHCSENLCSGCQHDIFSQYSRLRKEQMKLMKIRKATNMVLKNMHSRNNIQ